MLGHCHVRRRRRTRLRGRLVWVVVGFTRGFSALPRVRVLLTGLEVVIGLIVMVGVPTVVVAVVVAVMELEDTEVEAPALALLSAG